MRDSSPALSLSAFAGSLELLLVGMVAMVTPLAAVALTVQLPTWMPVGILMIPAVTALHSTMAGDARTH